MIPFVSCEGFPGPTHHFGGLSLGNLPSMNHRHIVSHPQKSALESIEKQRTLLRHHIPVLVMPPHERPAAHLLERLGYTLENAPLDLLSTACSSSFMWTANMAIVTPSIDSCDQKIHITPANLLTCFHRSLESEVSAQHLKHLFPHAIHHPPLPSHPLFANEGGANHIRLTPDNTKPGLHLFFYSGPSEHYPGRESQYAVETIARLHQISPRSVFVEQSGYVIDKGVFHADLICMGCGPLLIMHTQGVFPDCIPKILQTYATMFDQPLHFIPVTREQLTVEEAVSSYLFNSQLVETERGICCFYPSTCKKELRAMELLHRWHADPQNPIVHLEQIDVDESLHNGGGPACLRLPLYLTPDEIPHQHLMTCEKLDQLEQLVRAYYPQTFLIEHMRDPSIQQQVTQCTEKLRDFFS